MKRDGEEENGCVGGGGGGGLWKGENKRELGKFIFHGFLRFTQLKC